MKEIDLCEKISNACYEFLYQSADSKITSISVFLSPSFCYSVLDDAYNDAYCRIDISQRHPTLLGATIYLVPTDDLICEVVVK